MAEQIAGTANQMNVMMMQLMMKLMQVILEILLRAKHKAI